MSCVTMATAAVLAGVALTGCGPDNSSATGGSPVFPDTGNPFVGPTTPVAGPAPTTPPPTSSACYQWNGLGNLNGIAFPLRQMASDEEIYGPGSDAANSDSMAVATAAMGLNGKWPELPSPYALEVDEEVVAVASSPSAATPAQLDAAATDATDLAGQIAALCFSNP